MKSVEEILAEAQAEKSWPRMANILAKALKERDEALRSVRDAALAEGRELERAAIVGWMRGEADRLPPWEGVTSLAIDRAADSIEEGDHRPRVPATEEVEDG
jgi:hypothetical protein